LPTLEESKLGRGWYVNNVEEDIYCGKLVLFRLPQDDWAETVETFSDLNLGWKVPELFLTAMAKPEA
jgi:hypothetical protein